MAQLVNLDTFSQALTQVGHKGLDVANRTISTPKARNSRTHGLMQIRQNRTASSQVKAIKGMANAEMKMATAQSVGQAVLSNGNRQPGGGLIVNSIR